LLEDKVPLAENRAVANAAATAPRAVPAGHAMTDQDLIIPAIARDGSLFPIGKLRAHETGQKHLAVSVFVFSKGHLLIQKRARSKYHSGGQWANTCCSHPHWSEQPADCARRRLREELGLDLALHPRTIFDYRADVGNSLTENERVHVFSGHLTDPSAAIPFDPAEVEAVRWAPLEVLRRDSTEHPERFTPWFRIYLANWPALGLPH
jgi:isopentenyl-diphosphate delta-isomerase